MKGRWEKVWNMGNILWNYSTWPMGEWGIYCKVVPYWNSRGNSLTVQWILVGKVIEYRTASICYIKSSGLCLIRWRLYFYYFLFASMPQGYVSFLPLHHAG